MTRSIPRRRTSCKHYVHTKLQTRRHYANKKKYYEHKMQHYEYNKALGKDKWYEHVHHYLQLHFLTMPMTTCHLRGWSLQVYLQQDAGSLGESDNNRRTTSDYLIAY